MSYIGDEYVQRYDDGRLRTSLHDKRDDFNFHITNFPFLGSNISPSKAYGVFISQLIRYTRACSFYECFILRAARLSCKLLGQGYVRGRLKLTLRKFYGRYGDLTKYYEIPLSQMLHDILGHDHKKLYSDTLHWSDISLNHDIVTELDLFYITVFDVIILFLEVSIEHLQRVRLANRGRLLLRTPGPIPFGTCTCSNVGTRYSWTCHVYGPFEFDHPSVLLLFL